MRRRRRIAAAAGLVAGLAVAWSATAPVARAQTVITNGTVSLGVNPTGSLNVDAAVPYYGGVGVRHNASGWDGTYDGCTCEGWGAGVSGGAHDGVTGYAGTEFGNSNLNNVTFTSSASTATSSVVLRNGGVDVMRVTHAFAPAAESPGLYKVTVTIENLTGAQLGVGDNAIRYRRAMDWDVPTPGDEVVSLVGWPADNLLGVSSNGFQGGDVFQALLSECGVPVNTNFMNEGPCDHGAVFDFGFPALAAGGSRTFTIFYGAFANLDAARAGLGAVGAEVASWAFCAAGRDDPVNPENVCAGAAGPTFVFGFQGVGGTVIEPPPPPPPSVVPEPSTVALVGSGLLGILAVGRRRRLL